SDEWLGMLAAALVYYAAALILEEGLRPRALGWTIAGLTLLGVSRLTYWPAGLVVLVAAAARWKEASRGARPALLALLLVPTLAAGSWIVRNERLYGAWDGGPVAATTAQHPAGFLPGFHAVLSRDHVPAKNPYLYRYGLGYLLRGTFMSFWGVFGYMGLLMPPAYYLAWAAMCGLGIGYWVLDIGCSARNRNRNRNRNRGALAAEPGGDRQTFEY